MSIIVLELLLPDTFFTFRVYEGLIFTNEWIPHMGPFYPNRRTFKRTKGDLCPHTKDAKIKMEFWKTDALGFRNDSVIKSPDVVFIGNSFIYGTGLTQKDILSNKIKQFLPNSIRTYNMAPSSIGQLEYFVNKGLLNKPKVLVYCFIDREPPVGYEPFVLTKERKIVENLKSLFYRGLNRYVDKALRFYSIQYLKGIVHPTKLGTKDSNSQYYFGYGKNFPELSEKKSSIFLSVLLKARNFCTANGIKFYYMFTPSKELVYADILNIIHKRNSIYSLDSLFKENNLDGLNTMDILIRARKSGQEIIYHSDDTHWNKKGVEIISWELANHLRVLLNLNKKYSFNGLAHKKNRTSKPH